MCLTIIRTKLRKSLDSAVAIAALFLISLIIIAAHSEPSAHGMEGDSAGMSDAMSICLAVLQIGVLLLAGQLLMIRRRLRAPRIVGRSLAAKAIRNLIDPGHRIREGPSVLQVFRH